MLITNATVVGFKSSFFIFSFLYLLFDHRRRMRICRCLLDRNSPVCNQTCPLPNSYRFVSFPACRKEIEQR